LHKIPKTITLIQRTPISKSTLWTFYMWKDSTQLKSDKVSDYSNPNRQDLRANPIKKGWQVAKIWDRYHEVARLKLLGMSNKDIAVQLKITAPMVSTIVNSPIIKDKIAVLQTARDEESIDIQKQILELMPIALNRIREAVETGEVLGKSVSGKNILIEANNLIDRQLGKAIQRTDNRNLNTTLTPEDIESLKLRARELTGEIIEADFTTKEQ
jgi:hypothetical protein